MLKSIILIATIILTPLTAGYYVAPQTTTSSTLTVSIQNSNIKNVASVKTLTDTAISMLIFGGWAGQWPGMIRTMGPNAGVKGTIGPWIDTLWFNRLYKNYPPSYVIGKPTWIHRQDTWGDTTLLIQYYDPNVVFSLSRPGVLELAKDSVHGIFRVIDDNNQEVFIIARYAGLVDSLKIVTVKHPYCMPWPDCYYNPWWK